MMSIAHLLEDFGETHAHAPIAMDDVSLEDERLEAFEAGYQAGWDDAVKAQTEDARRSPRISRKTSRTCSSPTRKPMAR